MSKWHSERCESRSKNNLRNNSKGITNNKIQAKHSWQIVYTGFNSCKNQCTWCNFLRMAVDAVD